MLNLPPEEGSNEEQRDDNDNAGDGDDYDGVEDVLHAAVHAAHHGHAAAAAAGGEEGRVHQVGRRRGRSRQIKERGRSTAATAVHV